jgi:C_GCAxxG_C_C family probable redox protein
LKSPGRKILKTERALKYFDQGFSCSQSVLSAFSPVFGLNRTQALRIASAFGGGICRRGDLCGAITGGLMVIGLKHGRARANDVTAKEKTYRLAQRFMRWFERQYGTLLCRELIGVDLSKSEKRRSRSHADICREIVQATQAYLYRLLRQ